MNNMLLVELTVVDDALVLTAIVTMVLALIALAIVEAIIATAVMDQAATLTTVEPAMLLNLLLSQLLYRRSQEMYSVKEEEHRRNATSSLIA